MPYVQRDEDEDDDPYQIYEKSAARGLHRAGFSARPQCCGAFARKDYAFVAYGDACNNPLRQGWLFRLS